jgi:hypothetical protein
MRTASATVPLGLPRASQALEDIARPRAPYITHIPAVLLVTGLVAWIASNETGMVVAAAVGGTISLYLLWDWLFREGPTRFSTLLAMALLQGYGLGALNTWLTLPTGGLALAQFLGGDEGVYARGMAAVLIASAPLLFLGELFERPIFGSEFRLPLDQRTYLFMFLGTVAMVVGFLVHAVGYSGTQGGTEGQVSVASALLSWMFPPLTALSIAVFLGTRGFFTKTLMGLCTVVLFVLIMAFGRRNMVYTAVVVIFTLRLTGYRLRGTVLRKVVLIGGLGFFLAIGVTVFMLLRLAGFQTHSSKASLGQRIQIALSWVEDGTALDRATEANRTNVQRRTFVLGFFADVLEGSSRRTPALGRDFLGYASQAIPRVLNPEKDVTFGEEGLVDGQFGLTYTDAANSVLTNGAADFGFAGALVYPVLLVGLFRLIIGALSRLLPPLSVTFVALGMIFTIVQTESALTMFLVTIRNVIIFAVALGLFSLLPQLSLRNR